MSDVKADALKLSMSLRALMLDNIAEINEHANLIETAADELDRLSDLERVMPHEHHRWDHRFSIGPEKCHPTEIRHYIHCPVCGRVIHAATYSGGDFSCEAKKARIAAVNLEYPYCNCGTEMDLGRGD